MLSIDIWGRLSCLMTDGSEGWRDVEKEGQSFEIIVCVGMCLEPQDSVIKGMCCSRSRS